MSAYVVDREHIRYLVTAARSGVIVGRRDKLRWYHGGTWHELAQNDRNAASRMGQLLWSENVLSVQGRYPDCVGRPDRMPGPIGETFIYAHSADFQGPIEHAQLFKAIHCLVYQSCEHDAWKGSEAYAILKALEGAAMRSLPGYEKAEWGAPRPVVRS